MSSDERDCFHLTSNPVTFPYFDEVSLPLIMTCSLIICSAEVHAEGEQETVVQILHFFSWRKSASNMITTEIRTNRHAQFKMIQVLLIQEYLLLLGNRTSYISLTYR